MTPATFIDSIAAAIARMEGFFKSGSIAQRNHNPGNLRAWGKLPIVGGYAQFATDEDGWRALRRQIGRNIERGLTLYEFFGGVRDAEGMVLPGRYPGYAPAADQNHPKQYAEFVARQVGIAADVPLNEVIEQEAKNATR